VMQICGRRSQTPPLLGRSIVLEVLQPARTRPRLSIASGLRSFTGEVPLLVSPQEDKHGREESGGVGLEWNTKASICRTVG
jgi:hypothetical protein